MRKSNFYVNNLGLRGLVLMSHGAKLTMIIDVKKMVSRPFENWIDPRYTHKKKWHWEL